MDTTDHQIVALLRDDGRASYRAIASQLALTESTVRSRVKRLEDSNALRVVAVSDIEAAGFDILLSIGVEVEGRSPRDVAQDLAALSQVFSVSVVIGNHDIEILAVAADQLQVNDLLDQLAQIQGVRRLAPSLALDVLNNQPHWVPFGPD